MYIYTPHGGEQTSPLGGKKRRRLQDVAYRRDDCSLVPITYHEDEQQNYSAWKIYSAKKLSPKTARRGGGGPRTPRCTPLTAAELISLFTENDEARLRLCLIVRYLREMVSRLDEDMVVAYRRDEQQSKPEERQQEGGGNEEHRGDRDQYLNNEVV